jgi:transposase
MGTDRTVDTGEGTPSEESRAKTVGQSAGVDRDIIRAENRHSLGRFAQRNGLWEWDDVLATIERVGASWGLAEVTRAVISQTPGSRQNRLVTSGSGQRFSASGRGGEQTGPNPTDRAKAGTKHHIITEAQGIPLAALITAANAADITQLLPLVDAIPSVPGRRGRPRRRPQQLYADRGYDSNAHRRALLNRSIQPCLARRFTPHGSGLGVHRWVVERTLSWLHQFRRLRIRFERHASIHQAFLSLGCSLICFRFLNPSFC